MNSERVMGLYKESQVLAGRYHTVLVSPLWSSALQFLKVTPPSLPPILSLLRWATVPLRHTMVPTTICTS